MTEKSPRELAEWCMRGTDAVIRELGGVLLTALNRIDELEPREGKALAHAKSVLAPTYECGMGEVVDALADLVAEVEK